MKRVEINDAKKIANLAGINKNNLSAKENQQKKPPNWRLCGEILLHLISICRH